MKKKDPVQAFRETAQRMSNKLDCTITMTTPVGGEQVLAKPKPPTKKEVGYKVISGIRAVGNQCQDCANRKSDDYCDVLKAYVDHRARCGRFSYIREEG